MKRIVWLLAAALSWSSCSRNGEMTLSTEADSVAYVIGMNVGMNLLRMDSTLNVAAVCRAMGDVYAGRARFSPEQARAIYLRYVNYSQPERIRAYERQFLEDYVRTNRSYARTQSGLTYTVETVGDEQLTPKSDRDTVRIRYAVRTADEPSSPPMTGATRRGWPWATCCRGCPRASGSSAKGGASTRGCRRRWPMALRETTRSGWLPMPRFFMRSNCWRSKKTIPGGVETLYMDSSHRKPIFCYLCANRSDKPN